MSDLVKGAIKRDVVIGDCRLILGDCRWVLPLISATDAVVTDPPYGINLNTDNQRFSGGQKPEKRSRHVGSAQGRAIAGDAKPFDPKFVASLPGDKIIWGWNNYPDQLPRGACLVWLKRNDDGFGSFLSDAELAWFSKGHGVYCRRDLSNNSKASDRVHPTQKPVSLMEWCLGFLPKARSVLDPFMGSGSTGLACLRQGKSFVGIEIDEGYFEAACRRVEDAYRQGDIFQPKPSAAMPEQFSLLGVAE